MLDVFGVLILVRHSNNLLNYLVRNRLRTTPDDETYNREVKEMTTESKRRTWGGAIALCGGFSLQILGMIF